MNKIDTERGLLKSSLIYGVGNIGALILNFFLVPLYTFFLSQEELGLFDIVASSIVFLSPIFFGHIELSIIRWLISKRNGEEIKSILSNSFIIVFTGLVCFTLVYFVLSQFLRDDLSIFLFGYFVSNFLYLITKQAIRAVYSSVHYVISELIFTSTVLCSAVLLVKNYGLDGIFAAYSIAFMIFSIYVGFLKMGRFINVNSFSLVKIKELLVYSFPLIFNTFSMWLNNMSNKYFILLFLSLSYNGIYAVAFKIAYVLQILNRIFYFSLQDRMYLIYGSHNYEEEFKIIFKKYSRLLFSLLFLLISSQRIILSFIIDDEFSTAYRYVPILAIGVTLMSLGSVLGIIYQCAKQNSKASKSSIFAGIIVVILGFLLIPDYQLNGATLAFTIGNFFLFLYRVIDIQKMVKLKLLRLETFVMLVLSICLSFLSKGSIYLQVIGVLFSLIVGFLLNKEFVRLMVGRLQSKTST